MEELNDLCSLIVIWQIVPYKTGKAIVCFPVVWAKRGKRVLIYVVVLHVCGMTGTEF